MAELLEALPLAATIEIEPEPEEPVETGHTDNLAEGMDEDALGTLAAKLIADYEADKRSCAPSHEIIKNGLELLGVKIEEIQHPFQGACSAVYPLMLEAAVQFQARAIAELYPASGPVRTQIMGVETHERVQQAQRVREFMNYQLTEVMDEYYDELDQMLFVLPIVGSCFKKIYYDDVLQRPVSRLIPVENFIVGYHNTDLRTCGRYTHVFSIDANDLRKMQASGFYRDIECTPGPDAPPGPVQAQVNQIEGRVQTAEAASDRYTILEMHVDLNLPGESEDDIALPYIVSIEQGTSKVLAIRRNWDEEDELKRRLQWFVHYKYLPGLGFYGYGLVHILGNLQKSATAILRSLVDAGQYATLPAGFKAKGVRIIDGNSPVEFGEWRDVDNFGDDLRKALVPIPTKEPSQTLFALLQDIVMSARRLASIADINVGDNQNDETPVGTTLAMLEQAVKVMSAIHKRLHKSQREEFRILARINADRLPPVYPFDVEGGTREIKQTDFDTRINVLPVSDPNIFSETQRILKAQAMLQLAAQFPQVHNLREALFRMHDSIGTPKIDDVLVPETGPKPMDPVTEHFAVLHGKPIMAYAYQDHMAHIQSHMAFMTDPNMGGNQMMQQMILAPMMAHIADHYAHAHRLQLQAATGMPLQAPPMYDPANPNEKDGYVPLPPSLENEVARMQAMAGQEISKNAQIAAAAMQNQQVLQNPMYQLEVQKLGIEKQKADSADKKASWDAQLKERELAIKAAGDGKAGEAQLKMLEHQLEQQKAAMELRQKQFDMAMEAQKAALENQQKQLEMRLEKVRAAHEMATEQTRLDIEKQRAANDERRANHESSLKERELQMRHQELATGQAQKADEHRMKIEEHNLKKKGAEEERKAKLDHMQKEHALKEDHMKRDLALKEQAQKKDFELRQKEVDAKKKEGEAAGKSDGGSGSNLQVNLVTGRGKKRSVKFRRGKDGRIEGADVTDQD